MEKGRDTLSNVELGGETKFATRRFLGGWSDLAEGRSAKALIGWEEEVGEAGPQNIFQIYVRYTMYEIKLT